ncbi:hypothetical protein B0H17DRAFT_1172259, partial [Mycena rosella]
MMAQEIFRPAAPPYHGPLPQSRGHDPLSILDLFNNCNISYGLPFPQACAKHAEETFHAKRVFVISSRTLARSTSALKDLESALGPKFAGVKFGLKAHTYLDEIIDIAAECRTLEVDLIVTLGGGSLSDAAKMVSLALANDATQSAEFLKLPTSRTAAEMPPAKAATVPVVCVATTLSGAEFTTAAGATDERDNQKHQFIVGPAIQLVIFDAKFITDCTPLNLLLQSGVRAVDHCVEGMCSLLCNEVTEMHATMGLEQLLPALLRCKADGDAKTDVEARHLCQMASVNAIATFRTSSILLPAVCKYNALHRANLERQALVVAILWGVPDMRRLAESKGLKEGIADLGDLLDILVRALSMPRTLKEVGIGRDKLDQLAEYSLLDVWSATNPAPLKEKAQVMEILEMVAG